MAAGPARPPASGVEERHTALRAVFGLGLAAFLCIGAAQPVGPRIAYPPLPIDDRVASSEVALDGDDTDVPTPAEVDAAQAQIAIAQLSQNYRPRPAIWEIADRDTTIYLFGTIHILPPGFQWRNPTVDAIVARSDRLIVESLDSQDRLPTMMPGASPRLPPLATRVSPHHRAALERFTDTLAPEAIAALDGMQTWIAAVAVGYVRDFRAGEIPGPGADDWLEQHFRETGKPIEPIEDGNKVMAMVSAIPEAEQRRMLDLALDAPQRSRADLRAPMHAWAKGEVGSNSALTVDMVGSSGTQALSAPLLINRNRAWADSLAMRLRQPGTALFAAGISHFIGPGSLLDLLRLRGIKVMRVE